MQILEAGKTGSLRQDLCIRKVSADHEQVRPVNSDGYNNFVLVATAAAAAARGCVKYDIYMPTEGELPPCGCSKKPQSLANGQLAVC